MNTMCPPVGDHAGDRSTAGWLVRLAMLPSESVMTRTSSSLSTATVPRQATTLDVTTTGTPLTVPSSLIM